MKTLCAIFLVLALSACTPAPLRHVADVVSETPVRPDILSSFGDDPPVTDEASWRERRAPLLRAAFEANIYGAMPAPKTPRVLQRQTLNLPALSRFAHVEQWTIAVTDDPDPLRFNMLLITRNNADAPAPLIIAELFCGNRAAIPGRPESVAAPLTPVMYPCTHAWTDPLVESVFGDQINGPPFETVLARGYALALFYPGDVVADDAALAPAALERLAPNVAAADRPGAIAAWAWLFSRAIDAVEADPRIDASRIALWGHSRHGKAALLAAAFDPRPAAVIAHQSGRGGASLAHSMNGESVAQITTEFPHWFSPRFAALPQSDTSLDQHQLLALIAPRPILLGNGDRDAWSDPESAFRAARAASPVYGLYHRPGLTQTAMTTPDLNAGIAYFLRPGFHGVKGDDWRLFLDFLDDHLKTPQQP